MTKADIGRNPLCGFLSKISGVKDPTQRLRGRTDFQMWSSERFESVREHVDEEVELEGVSAQRGRVSKAQSHTIAAFKALPKDEQVYWQQRAKEDQAEVARRKEEGTAPPKRLDPAETQT